MRLDKKRTIIISGSILAVTAVIFILVKISTPALKLVLSVQKYPSIYPDYTEIALPPNIAPLNFLINEKGQKYYVKIYSVQGDTIRIFQKDSKIQIPPAKWRKLLEQNKGEDLYIEVYTRGDKNKWLKYNTIINHIVPDKVDNFLVYRLINPGYVLWDKMGIYSRNVENFNEKPIIVNEMADHNCMNCHSFCQNNPDEMIFHIRGSLGGTVLYKNGELKKINTATNYTMSAGVYPAWHPNGNIIAFSVNLIRQKFNNSSEEPIEVYDGYSDIILYDIENNRVTTTPEISGKNNENMPTWSPDGKYLYFCSAPEVKTIQRHSDMFYELLRISYNSNTGEWGKVDTVLSMKNVRKSISWPRISPDGKYLLFCMAKHGYFSIHYRSSDLYMLDLKTGKYHKLDINSKNVESFHSWSHNSRWIVFSSKKDDGLCARPYYCYINEQGEISKPFVLPQKDPSFYKTYLKNYNVPEMVSDKIRINKNNLYNVVNNDPVNVEFDPEVDVDALSGASKISNKKASY